jgi:hypothetical protein
MQRWKLCCVLSGSSQHETEHTKDSRWSGRILDFSTVSIMPVKAFCNSCCSLIWPIFLAESNAESMEAGGGASGLLLGVVANPGMVVGLDVGKPPRMFGFMLDVSILFTHYGTTVLLRWWRRVWFFDRWCGSYNVNWWSENFRRLDNNDACCGKNAKCLSFNVPSFPVKKT